MSHPGIDLIRSALGGRVGAVRTVEERRSDLEALAGAIPPPPGVDVQVTTVAGRPAERHVPDRIRGPGVVLYLHGGGYVSGSLNTHRRLAADVAVEVGRPVVVLDYRLAPEHPFPAGLDDARAALEELGGGGPVAVAGDSAGGGLTLAVLIAQRDAGPDAIRPRAAWCISPWADLTQSGSTYGTRADADPMLSAGDLDEMAAQYLQGQVASDPLASPLGADLHDLPPVRIDVGDAEVLLDDSVVVARRLAAAGGSADLTVWPEMIHVFPAFPSELVPEAGECRARGAAFLAAHLT